MRIEFAGGESGEGMILSLNGPVMRVAILGGADVCEFRLVNDRWISERCEIVSFTFPPGNRHEEFQKAVEEATKPVERLPGSPRWEGWLAKLSVQ